MTSKEGKLEYANIISDDLTEYLLLGTLARALGKPWQTTILAPENKQEAFYNLRKSLKSPDLLTIIPIDQVEQISKDTKLTLSAYTSSELNNQIRNSSKVARSHLVTVDKNPDMADYDLISEFSKNDLKNKVLSQ